MVQTLKQKFNSARLEQVKENIRAADTKLITEELNKKDLDMVSDVVGKLAGIKDTEHMPILTAAVESATVELNDYINDKKGKKNPVKKIVQFADVLESFFKMLPQIIKNNLGKMPGVKDTESIHDAIAKVTPKNSETVKNNIEKQLKNALTIKKGWFTGGNVVPYIANDVDGFIQEIMNVQISSIGNSVKVMAGVATVVSTVANDVKTLLSSDLEDVDDKKPAGEHGTTKAVQTIQNVAKKLKNNGVDVDTMKKVMAALRDAGMLKDIPPPMPAPKNVVTTTA